MLSSAGWVVHDVGLAASIGGTLFGSTALEPSLNNLTSPEERDRISADAWQRFSWVNIASHLAFAVPWFIGRGMLNGREVTAEARPLTLAKDVLVGVSLITGIGSIIAGRFLGSRARRELGPAELKDRAGQSTEAKKTKALHGFVNASSMINMAANIGILGLTALLAMEGNKSGRFAVRSRWLP